MTALTEGRHTGEGILSEARGHRSRDNITIASGAGIIAPMTVLGMVSAGAAVAAAGGGNTGNGTLVMDVTTPVLSGVQPGVYRLTFATLTTVELADPNGDAIDVIAIGGAEGNAVTVANQIKAALTQGATPFAIGDTFTVTVAAGSGEYVPSPNAADPDYPGAEVACAICIYGGDATSAAVEVAGLTGDAEVVAGCLSYDASVDDAGKKAAKVEQLRAAGIKAR